MLTFAMAILLLLSSPGPGVLSTAGVGAAFGYRNGIAYVTGLCIGSNLVMLAVVSGLAALVLSIPGIKFALLLASGAYLIYLASKIAFSGSKVAFIAVPKPPGIRDGIALQALNPKAYVVGATLFSGFPFWQGSAATEIIIKFIILNAIWIPIHLIWLWAGVAVNRLNLPDKTQRNINYAMALSMLVVVGLAVYSTMKP